MPDDAHTTADTASLELGTVRVRLEGPAEGPVALLIHGMSYPLEVWGPLTERLVAAGHQVLRYDLYGRGESTFTGGALTPEALARQAVEVCAQADVADAHVITLSNSDLVAMALGVAAPERVGRVTMVAPSGHDARTMNARTRLGCRTPGVAGLVGASLRKTLSARMMDHASHLPPGAPESTHAIYTRSARTVRDNPDFAAAVASHMGHMPSHRGLVALTRAYAATEIPTTLVHYDEETDATEDGVQVFHDHLPSAREVRMARGNHMGLLAYPDDLAQAVLAASPEAQANTP